MFRLVFQIKGKFCIQKRKVSRLLIVLWKGRWMVGKGCVGMDSKIFTHLRQTLPVDLPGKKVEEPGWDHPKVRELVTDGEVVLPAARLRSGGKSLFPNFPPLLPFPFNFTPGGVWTPSWPMGRSGGWTRIS